MITRDAGSNMMTGLNPAIKDGDRLFEVITDITHAVDSQFRNCDERSVSTLKRFVREACRKSKNETFPVLRQNYFSKEQQKCVTTFLMENHQKT